MLSVDEKAPDFFAESYHNGAIKDFGLADLNTKWKILLFYVADYSKVCPTEIIAFNQDIEKFNKAGASLVGISTDDLPTHEKFARESNSRIAFPLVADTDGIVSAMYGVFDEREKKTRRATFIIDENGKIAYACISINKIGRSTHEIYRVLRALQSGEACAVNWEPKDLV